VAQKLRAEELADSPTIREAEPSAAQLLGGIVSDAQKLVRQEITLARVELNEEWRKAKLTIGRLTVAMAMGFVSVFLAAMTAAHVLMALGVVPWLGYLLVTAVCGGIAYVLTAKVKAEAQKLDFVPRQAVETMKENVQWIKNQS
jgi:uncharacterized membrane protein YqjE